MVQTSGMDSYFKDAITAPYGDNPRDIITIMGPWCESPTSRAVHIDNKYFTYNAERDTYDVTLTLWAGDSGTPFEETLYPSVFGENHEDYKVSGLQMKLANGKSYLPVSHRARQREDQHEHGTWRVAHHRRLRGHGDPSRCHVRDSCGGCYGHGL